MSQKKKTITISEEHHKKLGALRSKNQTFDQVVGRLLEACSGKGAEPGPEVPLEAPLSEESLKALEAIKSGNENLDQVVGRLLEACSGKGAEPGPEALLSCFKGHGTEDSLGVQAPEEVVKKWYEKGFSDPFEVKSWLEARCFDPSAAAELKDAGITPVGAAVFTYRGGDYTDTVGYKFAKRDLDLEGALEIVKCHF